MAATRTFTCQACGRIFQSKKLSPLYCANRCRTAWGRWSYPANHQSNARVYGTTKQ